MVRLISDFDGVIVDLSERYYQVYCWRLQQVGDRHQPLSPLSKTMFWQLKRSKASQTEIGLRSGLTMAQIPQFAQLRHEHAHRLEHMRHDRLISGSLNALHTAQNLGWDMMIVTMRRTSELAEAFRLYPELDPYFGGDRRICIPDHASRNQDILEKPLLMGQALAQLNCHEPTWMVGDTEADIVAAQQHNLPVIAVLSGIRDRQILANYQPTYIAENLQEAIQLIASVA